MRQIKEPSEVAISSSPESLLGIRQWQDMLCSPVHNENLVAVVVDEAHCICTYNS